MMINKQRRNFLRFSGATVATGALSACGGGAVDAMPATASTVTQGGGGDSSMPPNSGSGPVASVPVQQSAAPAPVIGSAIQNATFTVSSSSSQLTLPFCMGFAFRRGDVPAGCTVKSDKGSLQVTVKNRWPDGSLKFAILAGQVEALASTGVLVSLILVTDAKAGTAVPTTRLAGSGAVAEIGCGSFGTVTWQGTDWNSPFKVWAEGDAMSSWIYRKPVGADAHLVAWLEVRMWANGAIEMLPWIENGYLQVAGPSNKLAAYSFKLGGVQRMSATIDLKHHQRTPLISGPALSYWVGTDAGVIARQNAAYLQASELVPSYQASVAANAAVVQSLVASYTPLQAGNLKYDSDSMASSGYQDPIGLLPQHDVLFLVADSAATYNAVVRNGFSAGRYGIHYRDETTFRPLRFSTYPTLNIRSGQGFKDTGGSTNGRYTPVASGGNPPQWDVAHSPSVGFVAYLATGRFYFMEEVQFATTANYLGNGDNAVLRTGSKGLVQPCPGAWQTRACAWDWRARVQALCVTPDDDTGLRSEFIASVEANIDHFHGRYVAQANNPYGWIKPGETYDGSFQKGSPWQQDFVTAAFGYSLSLDLPVSSASATKLAAFFAWKAKSAVMRLGTRDGFWYVNGVPYTLIISPSSTPNYDTGTGPWHATELAAYQATYAVVPAWMGATEGKLAGEIMPGERALWGNLIPAIAYAVRHNVPGAKAAYERVRAASNWKTLSDAFNVRPVWAVKPARESVAIQQPEIIPPVVPVAQVGDPVWLTGAALGAWTEIANTSGAGGSAVDAYSGFAYNDATNEILIAAAGGHSDSSDNRVVALALAVDRPVWRQLAAPSPNVQIDVAYYADGKPSSRHTYSTSFYSPQLNKIMLFGARGTWGNAHFFSTVDSFDLATNTWDPAGTHPNMPSGGLGAVQVKATGEVWSTTLAKWSPVSRTWTQPISKRSSDLIRWPIAHDTTRNQLFSLNWADGMGYSTLGVFATRTPINGSEQISVTFNPSAALNSFIADKPTYSAMDYDPANDQFLFYCGQGSGAGRIYVVKPNASNVWDMSVFALSSAVRPPATPGAGINSRFRYIPKLRGFVLMPHGKSNLFFIRTSA